MGIPTCRLGQCGETVAYPPRGSLLTSFLPEMCCVVFTPGHGRLLSLGRSRPSSGLSFFVCTLQGVS